jgi:micrococcal nuclease
MPPLITKSQLTKTILTSILIIIPLLIIFTAIYFQINKIPLTPSEIITDNYVTKVIDGDTFVLANNQSVRLICINTPELGQPGSQEAKEFLEDLILNKEVRLEKDISETDRYGRLLRYVYITNPENNNQIFINKELVQQGYAQIYRYEPDISKCDEIES